MSSASSQPQGHPVTAAAVVGTFSVALVLVMMAGGVLERWDGWLRAFLGARGFRLEATALPAWADLLAAAAVGYPLAWVIFETPGMVRRILLVATVAVLAAMASAVAAMWGGFWSPLASVIVTIGGGMCAIIWARTHLMPCERPDAVDTQKVIPIRGEGGGAAEPGVRRKGKPKKAGDGRT